MKSTTDFLNEKDRMGLADLYEYPEYKSLKKLLEVERLELAKDCLAITGDRLLYIQGGAAALKKLHKTLQENYRQVKKTDQS